MLGDWAMALKLIPDSSSTVAATILFCFMDVCLYGFELKNSALFIRQ
jgi:hypothetical protein